MRKISSDDCEAISTEKEMSTGNAKGSTKQKVSRYNEIEYIKNFGTLQQFLICKEAITEEQINNQGYKVCQVKDHSFQSNQLSDEADVLDIIMKTIVQWIKYLAKEHSTLLEIIMWLPLILMILGHGISNTF